MHTKPLLFYSAKKQLSKAKQYALKYNLIGWKTMVSLTF